MNNVVEGEKIQKPKRWTLKETEDLIKLYNKLDNDKLMEHFNRTYISIYKKARSIGLYKTPEMKFINMSNARRGEKASNWKGGRKKTNSGYIVILDKQHPRGSTEGYVFEHIVVMERHLGRFIGTDEAVHHINGVKDDNRLENLEVMGFGEHTRHHHLGLKRSLETRKLISKRMKERYKQTNEESVVNE